MGTEYLSVKCEEADSATLAVGGVEDFNQYEDGRANQVEFH